MPSTYQRSLFSSSAPHRPYCSDDLDQGVRIRPQAQALAHRYIQHNPPKRLAFLVFDFDRPGSAVAWDDAGLPQPSWVAESRDTRRGHIAYALSCPVITSDVARAAPLRYAASLEQGYRDALKADSGYSNFLTKTPGHLDWQTHWGRAEPFSLEELAEYLPHGLPKVRKKTEEASGLGRNVSLFEGVRQWSYRARLRFSDFDQWQGAVLDYALNTNNGFSSPLPRSEVKATAKSIAKWVWLRFDCAGFSEVQRQRQALQAISRQSAQMDTTQRILELR